MKNLNYIFLWIAVCSIGLGGGWFLSHYASNGPLIGAACKTTAVFIGTVWVSVMSFALKISEVTDFNDLSWEEHQNLEDRARGAIKKVWWLSGLNAICAFCVLYPSVLADGKVPIPIWAVYSAGFCAGICVSSVFTQSCWQEEFRRFKSDLRLRARQREANKNFLKKADKEDEAINSETLAAMSEMHVVNSSTPKE